MATEDLSEFEERLLEWIRLSDFETVAWSTPRAAEAFEVDEHDIYEALAALSHKVPERIWIHYKDGAIRITAD